ISLKSRVTGDALDLQDARLGFAGGNVTAKGHVPFGDADTHLTASWSGVDATMLTSALAGPVDIAPSGALSGELNATGPLAEISKWSADVRLRADGGATRRGRLAIPGETRLQLADGRWRVESHVRVGNTVPLALVARGVLND